MVTGIANWLVPERAARNTSSGQADLIEFLRRREKIKHTHKKKRLCVVKVPGLASELSRLLALDM